MYHALTPSQTQQCLFSSTAMNSWIKAHFSNLITNTWRGNELKAFTVVKIKMMETTNCRKFYGGKSCMGFLPEKLQYLEKSVNRSVWLNPAAYSKSLTCSCWNVEVPILPLFLSSFCSPLSCFCCCCCLGHSTDGGEAVWVHPGILSRERSPTGRRGPQFHPPSDCWAVQRLPGQVPWGSHHLRLLLWTAGESG